MGEVRLAGNCKPENGGTGHAAAAPPAEVVGPVAAAPMPLLLLLLLLLLGAARFLLKGPGPQNAPPEKGSPWPTVGTEAMDAEEEAGPTGTAPPGAACGNPTVGAFIGLMPVSFDGVFLRTRVPFLLFAAAELVLPMFSRPCALSGDGTPTENAGCPDGGMGGCVAEAALGKMKLGGDVIVDPTEAAVIPDGGSGGGSPPAWTAACAEDNAVMFAPITPPN